MSRFRRRGFRRMGTREQVLWFRFRQTQINAAASEATVYNIFTPASVLGNSGLDGRYTVRAIRLEIFQSRFAASAQLNAYLQFGVFLGGLQEPAPSARLTAATDQQTDWLDFFGMPFAGSDGLTDQKNAPLLERRIKAMRKVNNDEAIGVQFCVVGGDGTVDTTGRSQVTIYSSVLFQRTRR